MRISSRLAPAVAAGALLCSAQAAFAAGAATAAQAKATAHKAKGKKAKGKSLKLTGGTISLTLTPAIASSFQSAKIVLAPVAPATGGGTTISMPITSGKLNTKTGDGKVVAAGGKPAGNGFTLTQTTEPKVVGPFEFGGGEEVFSLSAPITVTIGGAAKYGAGTGTNLAANVNGSTTPSGPFFTLKVGKPKRKGSTIVISGAKADLTSAAAEVLDSFSGVKLSAGEELATIAIEAKT